MWKIKYYEFIKERYDPLPLANWQQDGFPFDYNSVMLSTFYDNNLKSLDALVQNYDPSEYSILKNSDNSRNVYGAKMRNVRLNNGSFFIHVRRVFYCTKGYQPVGIVYVEYQKSSTGACAIEFICDIC